MFSERHIGSGYLSIGSTNKELLSLSMCQHLRDCKVPVATDSDTPTVEGIVITGLSD